MPKKTTEQDTFTQAAELLRRYARGVNVGSAAQLEQQAAIVTASASLAIAAELRDLQALLWDVIHGEQGDRGDEEGAG